MKRLIADIHMHTLASGHAYGTIREMARPQRNNSCSASASVSMPRASPERWTRSITGTCA